MECSAVSKYMFSVIENATFGLPERGVLAFAMGVRG
jgi:hypothetical protein